MKVTEYIVKFLKEKGVQAVFELSGGMIMQMIDSLYQDGTIDIVTIHHEQAAAFAADAVGRLTGIPGVALATSGPGATNLLTGIGSCYFDSSPAVFITGQVNRHEQKGDRNIRQLGFQETDIISIVRPLTKFAVQITHANQVQEYLEKAFAISVEGRPGPVVLDIPMDIFRSDIELRPTQITRKNGEEPSNELINKLLDDLKASQRPLILAGGGIHAGRAADIFRELIETLHIPVVSSLMGIDYLPYNHPLKTGMIGTYGNRWSNISLSNSDFILVLGSRLDIRQTGADTESFKKNKTIYHVDCEEGEINNRITGCEAVITDIGSFMTKLNKSAAKEKIPEFKDWKQAIIELKEKWPDTNELQTIKGINPNAFMHLLSDRGIDFSAYVADVGQHQMWAAQSLKIRRNQRFITSGGMGAMGFSLPAAIGVATVDKRPVCVIAGDAGFQLNIQELQTVVRKNLPVKIVVINNQCHGMTRQFQETYFDGRYQSTIWGYSVPDFKNIAEAYGIEAASVSCEEEIPDALEKMSANNKPFLLNVMIDTFANAYPKMAFGLPMSEMEPFAKPMEMEGT